VAEIRFEHPLKLPEGWRITPIGEKSNQHNFSHNLTLTEALTYLFEEAQQLDVPLIKVSSNFQHVNNERTRKQISKNNGFALQVKFKSGTAHLACDNWMNPEHNVYALYLAIKNLGQFEKWGVATTEFMFAPFMPESHKKISAALEGDSNLPDWMIALGLGPTSTIDDANAIYRSRAKAVAHDEDALLELNNAMDIARKKMS